MIDKINRYLQQIFYFSDIVCLFANHGDRDLNQRILRKLGYIEYYKQIAYDFHNNNRHYVVVNMSPHIFNINLRLCTNLFGERSPFVEFY